MSISSASFAATLAGSLQGKFSINDHGAAIYSIGVAVPPGVGGLEPTLSLEYNSQSKGGLLGVGWNYASLTTISRCGQSKAIEGSFFTPGIHFDYGDRYCLNGERLITDGTYGANGTTYATETDKWLKAESVGSCGNGPCTFLVADAQGTKHVYGGDSNTGLFKAIGRDERLYFPLTSSTDRNGNVINYQYQLFADGEVLLTAIEYNQNKVVFNYEARPDTSHHYLAGQLYKSTQRLTSITTYASSSLVQTYQLSYDTSPTTERSRITSIQRCGNNDCLPVTVFDYKESALTGLTSISNVSVGGWSDVGSSHQRRYLSFDHDLDGKTDLIEIFKDGGKAGATVWFKGDVGFHAGPISDIGDWADIGSSYQREYLVMDHDRDGRTDIIELYESDGSTGAKVWRNSGSGFESGPQSEVGGWASIGSAHQRRHLVFDANKDGWTDIVELYRHENSYTAAKLWLNQQGNGFAGNNLDTSYVGNWSDVNSEKARRYLTVDANGDGMTDILEIYHLDGKTWVSRFISHGAGFNFDGNTLLDDWVDLGAANGHQFYPMDVNGDGLQDLVKLYQKGSNETGASIFWNTGTQFVKNSADSGLGNWKNTDSSESNANLYLPMDVNGDGRADLVKLYEYGLTTTRAEMWYGSNDGFIQGVNFHLGDRSSTNAPDARRYLPMDTNGDGLAEIVELYKYNDDNTHASILQFDLQADQDQIIAITDGLGEQTTITYSPLSNPEVYSRDKSVSGEESNAAWRNITFPLQVVQQHQVKRSASADCSALDAINDAQSDTIDTGCYQFTYQYEEAIADLDRGWQGFKRLMITDEQYNTEVTQTYSVDYPLTGRLLNKTTREADTQNLMSREEYAYHTCRGDSDSYGHCKSLPSRAHRVFLDDKSLHHYTLGTPNYTLMTRYGYYQPHLSNGQPITVTYDGDAKLAEGDGANTLCYQFASATDEQWWKRSFATHIKQTHWQYGNCFSAATAWSTAFDLNWKTFAFDEQMNVVSKSVYLDKTSSGDLSGHWLTTTSTYDGYGNLLTQTQPTGLVTEFLYDATHTFVKEQSSIGAGLTLTSTFEYDAGTGQRILETSPQGFQSKFILDDVGRAIEIQQTGPDGSLVTMATRTYQKSPTQTDRIEVITRHRKDWNNDVVSSWPSSTKLYDGMGTAFEAYKPGDSWQHTITGDQTYNHKGQVNKAYFAYLGNSTSDRGEYNQYSYDEHGRLTRIESSFDGQATEYDYNLHDDRAIIKKMDSPVSDGAQVTYKTQHNTRGKVIAQTGPSGGITRYEYDPLNRVTKITDPLGQQRFLTYNSLGQKLSDSTAETGTMTYAYDSYGRLSSQSDATGRTVTRTYDQRSRIIKQVAQYEKGTTETGYTYKDTSDMGPALFGRLSSTSVTTNDQTVVTNTYRYNLKGLKTQHYYMMDLNNSGNPDEVQDTHLIEFSYDAMDQLASLTYPDGSVVSYHHGQDDNNLLTRVDYDYAVNDGVNNTQATLAHYQNYHVNGKAKDITYGNGITETRAFDEIGRLLTSDIANTSNPLLQRSYTWNR
ncbi:SpvB/TcaC N-terminal domain-containing protein, partial [Marinomonas transparens]